MSPKSWERQDHCSKGATLYTMNFAAVVWSLLAFAHSIVSNHSRNAQTIIGKNFSTSFRLRHAVFICGAPSLYRCFIPEK